MLHNEVRYGAPTSANFAGLRAMAKEAFSDTFAHLYQSEPFTEFLEAVYGADGHMQRDLCGEMVSWRVATGDEGIVGYAKLVPLRAPAPAPQPGAMELQQLYVLRQWHGRGVAARLMDWALDAAFHAAAPEIYLTVFDHNLRAKRFYARYGFTEVGRCTFTLGDRVDDDRVWRRSLGDQLPGGQWA